MIYSQEAMPLFEQFKAAVEEHAAVIREFSEFTKTWNLDPLIAEDLLKRMEAAGDKQAQLLHQLQPYRLDV
ncbi:MAG TPA: hypothetical protein PK999_19230 [Nitrospira sp.]|nr:hypothetical protein [Nitrospira sp.]